MLHFSIGLITDEEEIPVKEVEASPDDRMEMIIFNNLGQYNTDFLVYCGDTEIWSAKEYGGASFDLSPYDGRELMVYHPDSKKLKILFELKRAYKNATDKLAHFFVKSPMPHIQLCVEGVLITALVDTGAQLSIITRTLAEKCGILGRLDSRFQVDAQGIGGVSKAIGKILDECSLGSELIIGVDILSAYNVTVDFKKKCVRFNEDLEVEMMKLD